MPSLGFPELILVLVIALVLFGPGKLPQVGSALGKAMSEFKKASRGLIKDDSTANAAAEDKKEQESE